jgi:hypothetical protein
VDLWYTGTAYTVFTYCFVILICGTVGLGQAIAAFAGCGSFNLIGETAFLAAAALAFFRLKSLPSLLGDHLPPPPTEEEVKKQNRGLSPMLGQKESTVLSKRTLWLITAGLLSAVVVTGAVAVNTYRLVTPEGVRSYFFVETASYEWKQVSSYTIDCENEDDGLSVTFTMRDGKKYEILQGVNSATKAFKEQYTSVTHFAADVDEKMMALQVPRNVKHIERAVKVYRGHNLWPYVEKLIGYVELNPLPDETIPETEPPTEEPTAPATNP